VKTPTPSRRGSRDSQAATPTPSRKQSIRWERTDKQNCDFFILNKKFLQFLPIFYLGIHVHIFVHIDENWSDFVHSKEHARTLLPHSLFQQQKTLHIHKNYLSNEQNYVSLHKYSQYMSVACIVTWEDKSYDTKKIIKRKKTPRIKPFSRI
jgi:hypothetical protein